MPDNYRLQLRPKARAEATIAGDCWRFTVLTNALIRMEYQPEGLFTDEATQTILCRDFPVQIGRASCRERVLSGV